MKTEFPGWFPLAFIIVISCQAAYLTAIESVSETAGRIYVDFAVPLEQVRTAIGLSVLFGCLIYYGIWYCDLKINQQADRQKQQ